MNNESRIRLTGQFRNCDTSSKPRFALLLVLCVLCTVIVLSAQVRQPVAAQIGPKIPPRPPAKEFLQSFFFPLVSLEDPANSEFLINNNATHPHPVTLQLYTLDGQSIPTKSISLQAGEMRFLKIADLFADDKFREKVGGLSASYFGRFMEVTGQVTILSTEAHGSIDMPMTDGMEFGGETQHAVWYAPKSAIATLALGNASESELLVKVQFGNANAETVKIPAHGTRLVVEHPTSKEANLGTVSLSYVGAMGALRTEGFLIGHDGYTSSIRAYDPMGAQQSNLYATNIPIAGSEVHVSVFNTSDVAISVSPKATSSNTPGIAVALSPVALQPHEAQLLDLDPLMSRAQGDPRFANVALTIINSGTPGSLIGHLSSTLVDSSKQRPTTIDVPLRDSGTWDKSAGIYPLRWRSGVTQIVSITNVSDLPASFHASILYVGGQYSLARRSLQPGDTAQFNLTDMRDQQQPDTAGNKLPRLLEKAKFHWSMVGDHEGRRLIGRNQLIDPVTHRASSFSCGDCPTYDSGVLIDEFAYPSPFFVGQSGSFYAHEIWNDEYGNGGDDPTYPGVSVSPSGVENVDQESGWSTAFAINGGTATLSYLNYWSRSQWDGEECIWDSGEDEYSWQDVVSDPTPNITGISPPSWTAGNPSISVTITGSGFGNSPQVNVSDPGNAVAVTSVTPINDGQINITVQVADTAPPENAIVTVTSHGYSSGFFFAPAGNPAQSPSVSVPINAVPTVSFTAPVGIPLGNGTGNFQVNIGPNPGGIPITLQLSTTTGTGDATFNGSSHQINLNGSATVPVMGATVSSTANNLLIQAKDPQGRLLSSTNFSVVSVTLSLRSSTGLTPSTSDSAAGNYQSRLGTNALGPFADNVTLSCNTGVEIVGTVQPSNYGGLVVLRRTLIATKVWTDSTFFAGLTTKDDTSDPQLRDDNPHSSNGAAYDLDAPGVSPNSGNVVWRARQNFSEYAVLDSANNSTPASNPLAWFSAVSCTTPDFQNFFLSNNVNIPGDNRAGLGNLVSLSWDLK
jgi:hypothetical protein